MQTIHPYSPQFPSISKSWINKLVWAEIEARKYLLDQQNKSQNNKWQTEFALPEVKLLLLTSVNIKKTHFQFAIYLKHKMNESGSIFYE